MTKTTNESTTLSIVKSMMERVEGSLYSFEISPVRKAENELEFEYKPLASISIAGMHVADFYDISELVLDKKKETVAKAYEHAAFDNEETPNYLFFYDSESWKMLYMKDKHNNNNVQTKGFDFTALETFHTDPNEMLWEVSPEKIEGIITNRNESFVVQSLVDDLVHKVELWLHSHERAAFRERVLNLLKRWKHSTTSKIVEINNSEFKLNRKEEDNLFLAILGNCQDSHLYRYTSADSFSRLLAEGTLSMSSIACMNDNTECYYASEYLNGKDNEAIQNIGKGDKQMSVWFNYNYYISSLSKCSPQKLLLWRLYGDDGKGIALDFDITGSVIRDGFYLAPVSYQQDDGSHLELDFVKFIYNNERFDGRWLILRNWGVWQRFFKPNDYKQEEEVRLLYCPDAKPFNSKWIFSNGVYFPISIFPLKDKEKEQYPLKLSKVFIGPRHPDQDVNEVMIKERLSQLEIKTEVETSPIKHYRINNK